MHHTLMAAVSPLVDGKICQDRAALRVSMEHTFTVAMQIIAGLDSISREIGIAGQTTMTETEKRFAPSERSQCNSNSGITSCTESQ